MIFGQNCWVRDDVSGRFLALQDQDGGVDQEVGKQANRGRKKWINPPNTPPPIKKKTDSVIVCCRGGVSKAGG